MSESLNEFLSIELAKVAGNIEAMVRRGIVETEKLRAEAIRCGQNVSEIDEKLNELKNKLKEYDGIRGNK